MQWDEKGKKTAQATYKNRDMIEGKSF